MPRARTWSWLAEGRQVRKFGVRHLAWGAAVLSGVLLWSAFPPQAQGQSGWFALIPLFLLIRYNTAKKAALYAGVAGMTFWLLTLSWFPAIIKNNGPWVLVLAGQFGLSLLCTAYLVLFAICSAQVWSWAGKNPGWKRVLTILLLDPLLWAGSEVLRGTLFTGFAWNFLGVSQVANLPLIQVASVGGVYGVSALLVMINGALASLAERTFLPVARRLNLGGLLPGLSVENSRLSEWFMRMLHGAESFVPLLLVVFCWSWGIDRVRTWHRLELNVPLLRVALIQPNSPCIFTLDDNIMQRQLEVLLQQTKLAGSASPDLVIWPETAVLGSVPYVPETMQLLRNGATSGGAPLLSGTLETQHTQVSPIAPDGMLYYNSAWLFSRKGDRLGVYRKQHLVPFGEYIPLDKKIPWLQRLAPTGVSCTSGIEPGVMSITREHGTLSEEFRLAPLICFEDTLPQLSRKAVLAGAQFLALLTNDAWFNGSIEPLQHMHQSVFRAIENGVPLVRATNSGVSGVINPVGGVQLLQQGQELYDFAGFMVAPLAVPERPLQSPYTVYGDWLLGYPGVVLLCLLLLVSGVQRIRHANRCGAQKHTPR